MTRNVEMLRSAARAFGDLRDEMVFVGGAIVDLLVTDPAAPRPVSPTTWTWSWR